MKQLNHCSARYDEDTLVSYYTLIYKRTKHYTIVYRYHSSTTTQHWYKFCAKIGIEYGTARYLWNYRTRTHCVLVMPHGTGELEKFYESTTAYNHARKTFHYPDELPYMEFGSIDL